MKKITLLTFLLIFSIGFAQNLPLDFESTTITYSFTDFDGGIATKIANPQISGINESPTVMQLVKGPGKVWAGSKIILDAPIDFTKNRIFKVKVLSPVAGIKLLLKFEGAGSFFQKTSSPINAANVWEELTFDFSADAVNNLNNQIVFMFDFGIMGDGGQNSTYLFDDITQSLGTAPILDLPILPLDFESTSLAYTFSDFDGLQTAILPNPYPVGINKSATVVKMVKNSGSTTGGCVIQMAGPIDFSTNKVIKVKVWSPISGKKLLLKFEGSPTDFDGGAFETEATSTKVNEWEELTFDYNSPTLFPPVNNNDNKIVFFYDFGIQGDGGLNSTFYIDDVRFLEVLSNPTFTVPKVKIYLDSASNQLSIDAYGEIQKVSIYNLIGQEVLTESTKGNNTIIQTSDLQKGVYIVKITVEGKETTSKFINE